VGIGSRIVVQSIANSQNRKAVCVCVCVCVCLKGGVGWGVRKEHSAATGHLHLRSSPLHTARDMHAQAQGICSQFAVTLTVACVDAACPDDSACLALCALCNTFSALQVIHNICSKMHLIYHNTPCSHDMFS
jgi:hypothetical protein